MPEQVLGQTDGVRDALLRPPVQQAPQPTWRGSLERLDLLLGVRRIRRNLGLSLRAHAVYLQVCLRTWA